MDASAAPIWAALRARLFGRVQITLGETPIPDDAWPRRTARTLLLLLLSAPGHRLPREVVIEQLWPESAPETAAKSLYVAIHALRRVLEPELRSGRTSSYVDVAGDVIRLLPGSVEWVDVEAFETELDTPQGDRRQHLTAALALYTGDFLADEPYLDWPSIRREQLRSRWREAVLEYAELERISGRPLLAVPAIERVIQSDPSDETAYRALMRALAAAGRREDALRQYERCAAALRDELGIEPGEGTEALAEEIRSSTVAAPAGGERPAGAGARIDNLPAPPNALVGRAREVEELLDLLLRPEVRLVTITGPGGVGKTRLALEAASLASDEFADGVCFVSLAPVRDPALVLPAVTRALGLEEASDRPPLDALTAALRDRQILLLLDNLEQVLEAASDLAALLAACPAIALLITSREPLHLRSEHDFPLQPLPAPDPGRVITAGAAARYPSVELFVERAGAVQRGFALTGENAAAIGTLCARLDGLPLAIELAAARARHLRPEQLVAGLADRFALLSGGFRDLPDRQRTMRGTIAWSYDLLPPDEQTLFRRLAIFAGGFTDEAAATLFPSTDPGEIQARLDALVDKGLIRVDETSGDLRYAMLETIREYGFELLDQRGELAGAGQAHAAWCVALAEAAGPELTGANQTDWYERLDREQANIRAALDRLIRDADADGELALRLAAPLWRFWWSTGYSREGRAWLEEALAAAPDASPEIRARALYAAGELAEALADYDHAVTRYRDALEIRQVLNDRVGVAEILNGLGIIARNQGDFARAEELHLEALSLLEPAEGSRRKLASVFNNLGSVAYFRGERERARHYWEQAVAIVRELGDQRAMIAVLGNLGALALMEQDAERAVALHQEALTLARRLDDFNGVTRGLINLAGALYAHDDFATAKPLYEEALGRCRDTGDRYAEAVVLYDLGKIAEGSDDLDLAATHFAESLALFQEARNLPGVAACLERIGTLAEKREEDARAVTLYGAAETIRTATGAAREPVDNGEYERSLGAARARLGEDAFATAWAVGAALSTDDAVAEALQSTAPAPSSARPERFV